MPMPQQGRRLGSPHAGRPAGGFVGAQGSHAGPMPSDLERREQEALQLIEAARRQAETIQRDAYHEGFAQGDRAGERLAAQKVEPVLQALQMLIDSLAREREALIQQYEAELIKVAFAIAGQVLHRQIDLAPEVVADVTAAALAKVACARAITIRVAPHDLKVLETQMRQRGGGAWPPAHVRIEEDETIGRGGCRLETDGGDIDATIETQMRVLRAQLWSE
jgi:flagellar assembly protein FliH